MRLYRTRVSITDSSLQDIGVDNIDWTEITIDLDSVIGFKKCVDDHEEIDGKAQLYLGTVGTQIIIDETYEDFKSTMLFYKG